MILSFDLLSKFTFAVHISLVPDRLGATPKGSQQLSQLWVCVNELCLEFRENSTRNSVHANGKSNHCFYCKTFPEAACLICKILSLCMKLLALKVIEMRIFLFPPPTRHIRCRLKLKSNERQKIFRAQIFSRETDGVETRLRDWNS